MFQCVFVFLAQLFCLVQDVLTGEFFAVLSDAVFRNEQEGLLFHRIVFQKFQDALMFVGLKVLPRALKLL